MRDLIAAGSDNRHGPFWDGTHTCFFGLARLLEGRFTRIIHNVRDKPTVCPITGATAALMGELQIWFLCPASVSVSSLRAVHASGREQLQAFGTIRTHEEDVGYVAHAPGFLSRKGPIYFTRCSSTRISDQK